MKTTTKIEISVEREEVVIFRMPARVVVAWCAECGDEVQMLTPEEAMAIAGARWQGAARIGESPNHLSETPDGRLFICINSL